MIVTDQTHSPTYTVRHGRFSRPILMWSCGHRHRTLTGAIKCLRSLNIDAQIYADDDTAVPYDVVAYAERAKEEV